MVVPNPPVAAWEGDTTYRSYVNMLLNGAETTIQTVADKKTNKPGVPKVLLFCPNEKPVLGAEEPNRPVVALDVAVADPNKLPVPAAIGLVGPFLPAW